MAEHSAPWRNIDTGDGKSYSHANWQRFWEGISGGLIHQFACIVPDSGNPGVVPCLVRPQSPSARGITIENGVAFVDGAYYRAEAAFNLPIAQNNSGQSRTDLVVLRRDSAGQEVRARIVQGTPGNPPQAPDLSNTSAIKDFPLAEVTVPNDFSSVAESHIMPTAVFLPNSTMQFVVLQNNTGATILPARLLEVDPDHARSVRLCSDEATFVGVSLGKILAGEWGVVQSDGVALVRTSGAVVRARFVTLSSTNGVADDTTSNVGTTFGRFLDTAAAAGYRQMLLFKQYVTPPAASWVEEDFNDDVNDVVYTTLFPPADTINIEIAFQMRSHATVKTWSPVFSVPYSQWLALPQIAAGEEVDINTNIESGIYLSTSNAVGNNSDKRLVRGTSNQIGFTSGNSSRIYGVRVRFVL